MTDSTDFNIMGTTVTLREEGDSTKILFSGGNFPEMVQRCINEKIAEEYGAMRSRSADNCTTVKTDCESWENNAWKPSRITYDDLRGICAGITQGNAKLLALVGEFQKLQWDIDDAAAQIRAGGKPEASYLPKDLTDTYVTLAADPESYVLSFSGPYAYDVHKHINHALSQEGISNTRSSADYNPDGLAKTHVTRSASGNDTYQDKIKAQKIIALCKKLVEESDNTLAFTYPTEFQATRNPRASQKQAAHEISKR